MPSSSSAVASSPSVPQLAMSPAATTSSAEGFSKPQPTAMGRIATVATMTIVTVFLVAATPPISCQ